MKITRIKANREKRKLIVVAYCRVSTKRDEQQESIETQKEYYENLIRGTEGWEFGGIYSDESSGLSAEDRVGFQQMIADGEAGKFDLVLCKSVSRFSRNIVECQRYADRLLQKNIPVSFEKEHLKTSDPTSRFVFSMMSAVAQDESRSISENVRWSNQQRVMRGEYNLGNNRILGYDSVDGKLIPNGDAWIVKMVFEMYADGKSYTQISRAVTESGGSGLRKHKPLNKGTISRILHNETYIGDKLLQKTPPRNYLTKMPDPDIKYESKYLKDDHEAIIDRALWDRAQARFEAAKKQREAGCVLIHRSHFLYGKVFCAGCGEPYSRKTFYSNPRKGAEHGTYKAWMCRDRCLGKKGNGCKNPIIREEMLFEMISIQMGWEWYGAEHFPEERFLKEVERVEIGNGIVVKRKATA